MAKDKSKTQYTPTVQGYEWTQADEVLVTGNDRKPQVPTGTSFLTCCAISLVLEAGAREVYKWDEAGLDPVTKRPLPVDRSTFLTEAQMERLHRVTVPVEDSHERYGTYTGYMTPRPPSSGGSARGTPSSFYCPTPVVTPRL